MMAQKQLDDDGVRAHAQRWAMLHTLPKNRGKMDDVLVGLSEYDQRRVYLCGQRISGGLPIKVLPPEKGKETKADNDDAAKSKRRRTVATGKGTGGH